MDAWTHHLSATVSLISAGYKGLDPGSGVGCFGTCMRGLFAIGSTARSFHGPFSDICRAGVWDRIGGTGTSGTAALTIVVYGNCANVAVSLH